MGWKGLQKLHETGGIFVRSVEFSVVIALAAGGWASGSDMFFSLPLLVAGLLVALLCITTATWKRVWKTIASLFVVVFFIGEGGLLYWHSHQNLFDAYKFPARQLNENMGPSLSYTFKLGTHVTMFAPVKTWDFKKPLDSITVLDAFNFELNRQFGISRDLLISEASPKRSLQGTLFYEFDPATSSTSVSVYLPLSDDSFDLYISFAKRAKNLVGIMKRMVHISTPEIGASRVVRSDTAPLSVIYLYLESDDLTDEQKAAIDGQFRDAGINSVSYRSAGWLEIQKKKWLEDRLESLR